MKKIHKYTSDDKLNWFGYGEWIEEPDEVFFEYQGYESSIKRVLHFECNGHAFGGHLCGYLKIPKDHPWYDKHTIFDFDCNVHGGITFAKFNESNEYWIGFDCAHSMDLIPTSMKNMKKIMHENMKEHLKGMNIHIENSPIFHHSYKNINFCMEEIKSLARQAREAQESTFLEKK